MKPSEHPREKAPESASQPKLPLNPENPVSIKLVHHTKERTRIRVDGKEQQAFARLFDDLCQSELILHVEANPRTKSLLVTHGNCLHEICDELQAKGYELDIVEDVPRSKFTSRLRVQVRQSLRRLDRAILDYTGGELDLQVVSGLTLLGMSYYQTFKRNKFLPAGETLLSTALRMLSDDKDLV